TEDGAPLPMVDGEPRTLQVEGRGASRRRLRTELDTAVEDQPSLVGVVAVGAARERVVRPAHLDGTFAPQELLLPFPGGALGRSHVPHPGLDSDPPARLRPAALDVAPGAGDGDSGASSPQLATGRQVHRDGL